MKPRRLVPSDEAIDDIVRRAGILAAARGQAFAIDWSDARLDWLTGCAEAGAQLVTEHPTNPSFRTLGYRRQATILAESTDDELRLVRVYFPGQDWTA